jgi:hypothetical protein
MARILEKLFTFKMISTLLALTIALLSAPAYTSEIELQIKQQALFDIFKSKNVNASHCSNSEVELKKQFDLINSKLKSFDSNTKRQEFIDGETENINKVIAYIKAMSKEELYQACEEANQRGAKRLKLAQEEAPIRNLYQQVFTKYHLRASKESVCRTDTKLNDETISDSISQYRALYSKAGEISYIKELTEQLAQLSEKIEAMTAHEVGNDCKKKYNILALLSPSIQKEIVLKNKPKLTEKEIEQAQLNREITRFNKREKELITLFTTKVNLSGELALTCIDYNQQAARNTVNTTTQRQHIYNWNSKLNKIIDSLKKMKTDEAQQLSRQCAQHLAQLKKNKQKLEAETQTIALCNSKGKEIKQINQNIENLRDLIDEIESDIDDYSEDYEYLERLLRISKRRYNSCSTKSGCDYATSSYNETLDKMNRIENIVNPRIERANNYQNKINKLNNKIKKKVNWLENNCRS